MYLCFRRGSTRAFTRSLARILSLQWDDNYNALSVFRRSNLKGVQTFQSKTKAKSYYKRMSTHTRKLFKNMHS